MECYMIAAFKYQTQTKYPFKMSSAHILLLFILEGHVRGTYLSLDEFNDLHGFHFEKIRLISILTI